MSDRVSSIIVVSLNKQSSLFGCLKILIESLRIFPKNKHIYFLILIFITLPLSLLHFSQSLSSYPIKTRILHLEYLATRAATRIESLQVWRESREFALSLFHLKLFYFLPTYFLSLIAAITVITSTAYAYNKTPITIQFVFSTIKLTWLRPLLTSFYIYAILLLYSIVPYMLLDVVRSPTPWLKLVIWVVVVSVELYLIAVLGLSLVVSIMEMRSGWDAIQVGWCLMEGRRICGWFLCGLMVVVTGVIGWRMEGLVVVRDDSVEEAKWMVMEGWEEAILVGLYGLAPVWGFIVTTVFYCECKKKHGGRSEEELHQQD
ncbi:uncharacterized protein [Euphorbia lathyris]|uniref:uncharacterized protein n=1 Tax=Euphorbia lathyris TaxID=212925 RepID=UPI0033140644